MHHDHFSTLEEKGRFSDTHTWSTLRDKCDTTWLVKLEAPSFDGWLDPSVS